MDIFLPLEPERASKIAKKRSLESDIEGLEGGMRS